MDDNRPSGNQDPGGRGLQILYTQTHIHMFKHMGSVEGSAGGSRGLGAWWGHRSMQQQLAASSSK